MNRGHHDFQGRLEVLRLQAKALLIGCSPVGCVGPNPRGFGWIAAGFGTRGPLGVQIVGDGVVVGSLVARRHPERVAEPLRAIQETGRQALTEMTRLLGVLRGGGEEIGLAPQPGLADLDALLNHSRHAGLPVVLAIEGSRTPLPHGPDLSAYRILQEALTNARRHAGPANAQVTLRYRDDALEIEVLDDGPGMRNGSGGGHGLIGMRERVAVFGGELETGPRAGGGFAVRATLPLEMAPR